MMKTLAEFLDIYSGIYEHSPWIAKDTFAKGPFETVEQLHSVMKSVVDQAETDLKLKLILAHPDLACAPSKMGALTNASQNEQSGAGLNQCSPQEYKDFQDLNRRYRAKFAFPFIIAVKGLDRAEILTQFQKRIDNDRAQEFDTALNEIHKIAYGRLMVLEDG